MGETRVKVATDTEEQKTFTKYLLKDLRALERMIEEEWFETDITRIGAEQEMCLVDSYAKPFPIALRIFEELKDDDYTTELALFNFEANLDPLEFKGSALSKMEKNIARKVQTVRDVVAKHNGDVLLVGITPTIRKFDLEMENLTPLQRYKALCDAISKLRGGEYELRINGMDELLMKFDSPLLEASNTGFQVHLQVTPDDFVSKYNIAQAITAPVLAAAVNSPILFGKRLWRETRVALFQQSVDTRPVGDHLRDSSPRVMFGNHWLKDGVVEVFKEDIARYRALLRSEITEDVDQMMKEGTPPKLMALQVNNSTVYRWNRPCYGISNGKPHLRIENRVLPSGPTVVDETANASFWLGLLVGMEEAYPDITQKLDFDDAKSNFVAASKMGLDTHFRWTGEKNVSASELILKEMLPIARDGLKKMNITKKDRDKYLDIIQERVEQAQTGAAWMLNSYSQLMKEGSREQTMAAITEAMIKNQQSNEPVHTWKYANIDDLNSWKPSALLVEEFMTTDIFTAHQDDILEFVSELMDWRHIRYVPIEDDEKKLVGLVTSRMLYKAYHNIVNCEKDAPESVGELMISDVITISPESSIIEAMDVMSSNKIGCLPVVKNKRLVGVITENNFMNITARLLKVLDLNK